MEIVAAGHPGGATLTDTTDSATVRKYDLSDLRDHYVELEFDADADYGWGADDSATLQAAGDAMEPSLTPAASKCHTLPANTKVQRFLMRKYPILLVRASGGTDITQVQVRVVSPAKAL